LTRLLKRVPAQTSKSAKGPTLAWMTTLLKREPVKTLRSAKGPTVACLLIAALKPRYFFWAMSLVGFPNLVPQTCQPSALQGTVPAAANHALLPTLRVARMVQTARFVTSVGLARKNGGRNSGLLNRR